MLKAKSRQRRKRKEWKEGQDICDSTMAMVNEQSYLTNKKLEWQRKLKATADTVHTYDMHVAEHNNLFSKVCMAFSKPQG